MVIISFLVGMAIGGLVVGMDRQSVIPERGQDEQTKE